MKNATETKDFCCLDKFSEEVISKLVSLMDNLGSVSIVADGDVIQELVKRILSLEVEFKECGIVEFDLGVISFSPEEYDGYNKEYILTLTSDFELWCEPMWRDNEYGTGYIDVESEAVYVYEDCDYQVLEKINSEDVVVFGVDN